MRKKILIGAGLTIVGAALLSSCSSIPRNARPVSNFDVRRYLGTWYELARFDYRFEKNLNNVAARYTLQDNGSIEVLNSGFNTKTNEWKSTTGIAKFRGDKNTAALKVSFFKPFYSGYNVVSIDPDYQYALVAGKNLKYLWILSRKQSIPAAIKKDYLQLAKEIGYDTSKLIWVKHDKENPFAK